MSELITFEDDVSFPSYTKCPLDYSADLKYYKEENRRFVPFKHWCFMGEITDAEYFIRLRLFVKDRTGKELVVAFYVKDRGKSYMDKSRVGSTIAILYPLRHFFLDLTQGFRVQRSVPVKIFPFPLMELISVSVRMKEYRTGPVKCQQCGKEEGLKLCAACGFVSYCGKDCQTKAWIDKNHKRDCKILRDADIRAMLQMDWNCFEKHVRFPLSSSST